MIDFEKIGKYEVTGKLGQGSFGVVYRGRDAFLKRDVAIKICSVEDEDLRKRFRREGEIAGRLKHRNIVTVYEGGFEGQIPYLVQELLTGEDLSRIVKRRAELPHLAKLDYLLQIAAGLGYAHEQGVIHRDVKPANIRVLEDGRVKIMDFGIAKLASAETQLTQKGITMGTASYLPPEQVRGGDLDHRADIFSFGVLAYELMAYQRPFRGNTLSALVYQILYKVPPPVITVWAESPEPLSVLIAKCLEKKPGRRFSTCSELIPELTAIRDGVAAGRWPALTAQPTLAGDAMAPETEPGEVLSQTAITQTARGVVEGRVGEYTISTTVPIGDVLRPPEAGKGRSTRPIEARLGEEAPDRPPGGADEVAGMLKTRILPIAGVAPTADAGRPSVAEPPGVVEDFDDLATAAREIRDLVAEGKLEEAREQLEATMSRTGEPEGPTGAGHRPSPPTIDPTRPTRVIRIDQAAGAAPDDRSTAAVPKAAPAAASPDQAIASDTYRTLFRPPFERLRWVAVAAAAVLVAGIGWGLLRGDADSPAEAVNEASAVHAAAPSTAEDAAGAAFVNAAPWAEVTEITDARGYVQALPDVVYTPLRLSLPPGTYKIRLRGPAGRDVRTCDLEILAHSLASCSATFAETDVTRFFKESGWWE